MLSKLAKDHDDFEKLLAALLATSAAAQLQHKAAAADERRRFEAARKRFIDRRVAGSNGETTLVEDGNMDPFLIAERLGLSAGSSFLELKPGESIGAVAAKLGKAGTHVLVIVGRG